MSLLSLMRKLGNRVWLPPYVFAKPEFGLEIGVDLGYSLAQDASKVSQIAALGVTWVRLPLAWDWIESQKGSYDWAPLLGVVDAFNSRNISALLVTNNPVHAAYSDPSMPQSHPPTTPQEIADYAAFHGLAAKMLGQRSVMYEIGNEVNWDYVGPQRGTHYTSVASATADQIRANYTGRRHPCTIIGPAVTPDHADFIQDCVPAGLFGYLNGCSVHPYGYGQPNWRPLAQLTSDYDDVRAMIPANIPIYASECGYSTTGSLSVDAFTPAGQAKAIVDLSTINRDAGIALTIWYEYADNATLQNEHERGFGLVDQNFVPKPSYIAAQRFLGVRPVSPPNPTSAAA